MMIDHDDKSLKGRQERINAIDIGYGKFLNGFFWNQETLTNIY